MLTNSSLSHFLQMAKLTWTWSLGNIITWTLNLFLNSSVRIKPAAFALLSTFGLSLNHLCPDNLIKPSWKIKEAEIFVSQTSWSWSTMWLLLPIYCINPIILWLWLNNTSSVLYLNTINATTQYISGRWQTLGHLVCFFKSSTKHSNAKQTNKTHKKNLENMRREEMPNFLHSFYTLTRLFLSVFPSTSHLFSVCPLRALYR